MKYYRNGKEILLKKNKKYRFKLLSEVREVLSLVPLKKAPKGWFSLGERAHITRI